MLLLSWTATAFIKGVAAVTRGDYMVFSSNMPLAGGNIASVGLHEWHANSVMWGASTAGTASVSPLQAAGCRLPAAGNVGLLFRYDGVQRLSGLWHDHQAPLARPTDSLVFLEFEDASGLAVAGFFDTWHSGSLDGLLASMMGRGQDTWPLPIELFGCLTTLAEHPDGNEGGAAGTPKRGPVHHGAG